LEIQTPNPHLEILGRAFFITTRKSKSASKTIIVTPPQYNSFGIVGRNVAGKNLEKIIKNYR